MKAFHKKRLAKLADHLSSGKLGHDVFDYNTWGLFESSGKQNKQYKVSCKTSGCALGECPTIFPRHWKYRDLDLAYFTKQLAEDKEVEIEPGLRTNIGYADPLHDAQEFFGISSDLAEFLFIAECWYSDLDCNDLDSPNSGATKKEVAKHIKKVLRLIEQGKIDPNI